MIKLLDVVEFIFFWIVFTMFYNRFKGSVFQMVIIKIYFINIILD